MSSLSTISAERAVFPGSESGGPSSPVPVPPHTRKRYSSSFEHRYVGSLGSNGSGNACVGGSSGKVSTAEGTGGVGVTAGTNESGSAEGAAGIQKLETPPIGKPARNLVLSSQLITDNFFFFYHYRLIFIRTPTKTISPYLFKK